MPVSRMDSALFSEVSYDMLGDKSKEKRIKKINKKIVKTGFIVDKKNSNRDILTLYNPSTNEVSISHRGTSPTRLKDLKADLAIATGEQGKNKEFKKRTKKTEQILDQYTDAKAYGSGHSYGSSSIYHSALSSEKVRNRMEKIDGFNGGASIISSKAEEKIRKDPEAKKRVKKIMNHHRVDTDVISASMVVNKPVGTVYTYREKLTDDDKAKRVAFSNTPTPIQEGEKALSSHGLKHFYDKDKYHNVE